jgi:hypothetical protein
MGEGGDLRRWWRDTFALAMLNCRKMSLRGGDDDFVGQLAQTAAIGWLECVGEPIVR